MRLAWDAAHLASRRSRPTARPRRPRRPRDRSLPAFTILASEILPAHRRGSARQQRGLRLKPVPVPPQVQAPELLLGLADEVALADQHLVGNQRSASPSVSSLQRTTARRLASDPGGRSSNRRTPEDRRERATTPGRIWMG